MSIKIRTLELPYSTTGYLYSRLSRILQSYKFMSLELEPGVPAYINDNYQLVEEKGAEDYELGLGWNNKGYVELVKYDGANQIIPVYMADGATLDQHYNSLWNTIESRLESKYGTRGFELYFSFERMQFILLPNLDLISSDTKMELFTKIWEVDAGFVDYILDNPELVKSTQTNQTYYNIFNQGYTPLWVSTGDSDRFRVEKGILLDEIIEKVNPELKLQDAEKKVAALIKSELQTKSKILSDSNYQLAMIGKPENLNKDFIRWVLIRDVVIDAVV